MSKKVYVNRTLRTEHDVNVMIAHAFDVAADEFGDEKSTEFLVEIVSNRLGITNERVYDALADINS